VVTGALQPVVQGILKTTCMRKAAPLYRFKSDFRVRRNLNGSFQYHGIQREWPTLSVNLRGPHQMNNAALALATVDVLESRGMLSLKSEVVEHALMGVFWPARLEVLDVNPMVLLDGAHNPAGARALAAYIKRFHAGRRITLIYGAMRDKSVGEITAILFPLADEVILVAPAQTRAVRPQALLEMSDHPAMRAESSLAAAIASARGEVTFLTGSLYLVGEARPLLVQ